MVAVRSVELACTGGVVGKGCRRYESWPAGGQCKTCHGLCLLSHTAIGLTYLCKCNIERGSSHTRME